MSKFNKELHMRMSPEDIKLLETLVETKNKSAGLGFAAYNKSDIVREALYYYQKFVCKSVSVKKP